MEGWSSSDAKLVEDATAGVERDITAGVERDSDAEMVDVSIIVDSVGVDDGSIKITLASCNVSITTVRSY